jgi:signal transduction histidine kinase
MASIATLTAGLAHEIRNPLNAASLQLELLDRACQRLPEEELRARLGNRTRIVREELARLTNLLGDFLNLARPRALTLEDVALGPLVDEVIELQAPTAKEAGIELASTIPADAPGVRGDGAMLKQVLVNLIVNAMEALRGRPQGPQGGHVTIGSLPSGQARVELSVEDDGPGIPAQVSEQLFVPFVTSKEAGSGLGLTIVKRIIDRHGGTIHVASRPGGGTRVNIHLARAR